MLQYRGQYSGVYPQFGQRFSAPGGYDGSGINPGYGQRPQPPFVRGPWDAQRFMMKPNPGLSSMPVQRVGPFGRIQNNPMQQGSTRPPTQGHPLLGYSPGLSQPRPVLHPVSQQSQQTFGSPGGATIPFGAGTGTIHRPNAGTGQTISTAGGTRPTLQNPNTWGYFDERRGRLVTDYDRAAQDLAKAYEDRYATGRRLLEGYGRQQVADAMQRGKNRDSEILQRMVGSGIGGSVEAAMRMAGGKITDDEIRRIQEGLQRQQTDLYTGLTGDTMRFREGALADRTGLAERALAGTRGDFEADRSFGEGNYRWDVGTGFDIYRDARNFARGAYEDDRNFGRGVFESDRGYQENRRLSDRDYAERQQALAYQRYLDSLNRRDRLMLERAGFMERRNDTYPDMNVLLQLMQSQGQYA